MGQEFCSGCQDCTNFKDFENNFSYFSNQPIKHLNNPSYENGNLDNSIFNIKTEYPSDASFLSNNNINGQNQKSDTTRNLSLSSKQATSDLGYNPAINLNNKQKENKITEKIFIEEMNSKENPNILFTEQNLHDEYYNFNKNNNFIKDEKGAFEKEKELKNNLNNSTKKENKFNYFDKEDKQYLEKIIINNKAKKISSLFRKFMEKKSLSHLTLCSENSSINDYENIQNNLRIDLTVNLIPEKYYTYIGTKFNNKKDGLGLELFKNSHAKFFGRFINDRRASFGRFIINNENDSYYYFGAVKGIHAEGFGWHQNEKKSIYYEGMWLNSKKEGIGIEINKKDNSEYRGWFKNGKKNGIGYYYWSDNSNYIGEWEDDNLDGYGIYNFQDGSIYKGHWKKNKMDGLGEFTFPEIKSYFGYFENDKRVGFGIMIWYKESKVFLGYWNDNKQHGPGKIINNGKVKYGIWDNGKFKEKISSKDNFISKIKWEKIDYYNFFILDNYNDILQKLLKILNA